MMRVPSLSSLSFNESPHSLRKSPEPGSRFISVGIDDAPASIGSFERYFHDMLKASGISYDVFLTATFAEGKKLIEELPRIHFAVIDYNLDNGMLGTVLCIQLLLKNPKARVFLFTAAKPQEIQEIPDGVTVIWDKSHRGVKAALSDCIGDFKREIAARKNSSEGDKG